MDRKGRVYFDTEPCGSIQEIDRGMLFVYDAEWLSRTDAQPACAAL